jgi:NAD(P)-binding Rossmann-like domain
MFGSKIHKDNSYDANSYTYYPVVIVGAGESGIAMGCRLREVLGFDQFRIFERQSGIGGTWWINRYPGVACDMYVLFPSLWRHLVIASDKVLTEGMLQTSYLLLFFICPESGLDTVPSNRPRNSPVFARRVREVRNSR